MEIRKEPLARKGVYRASYGHESMTEAYKAVIENNLPVQRAAVQYGVPITTLKDRVRGRVSIDSVKSGPQPLFTLEHENLLANHLSTMAEIGYGYSRVETLNLATDYAVHLGLRQKGHPLSLQWLYNFLGRWPDFQVKKPRSLDVARAKSATKSAVDNYFKQLDEILISNKLKLRPNAIFNVDEKGLSTEHKPPKIITGSRYKAQAVTSGRSQTVTVIGGVNAVGNQVPPFFIFPGKRMVEGLMEGASAGATGVVSETGWSNTEIFCKYMQEHLIKYLPPRDADSPVLVLYDGHKSHVSLGLIEWAQRNHIILFVLPPHCSHLLQPLDISCFGPFEVAWNSACHTYLKESGGKIISRMDVCRIACKVYSSTLTPVNIQSAFKKCGIFPFDSTVVNDAAIAPSLAFPRVTTDHENKGTGTSSAVAGTRKGVGLEEIDVCNATNFLENRGGEILKNVKVAKQRNTLSKVVGGKAITENSVVSKIKDHIERQKQHKRKAPVTESDKAGDREVTKSIRKGKSRCNPTKGKNPIKTKKSKTVDSDSDESDNDSNDDGDTCCVCKQFYPEEMKNLSYIKLVKWGQCDKCDKWVHLGFCSSVKVIRRGDAFFCPGCSRDF